MNRADRVARTQESPGRRFRRAVADDAPLQVVGAINAYAAILAEHTGFRAVYVSGGAVAAASCGVPDLGITTLEDVVTDVRRIADATSVPVLVDIDTGWGGSFNIARAIRTMERAGAAAVHIEDQVQQKRCGHRPGKAVVALDEMVDRVKAAVDGRSNSDFVIMARTDALAVQGVDAAIERAIACVEAGADMIFPEAVADLDLYARFVEATKVPVLANITEFGKTPLFTRDELRSVGIGLILYPMSAFRAMSRSALCVYDAILRDGSQRAVIDTMQTRAELYEHLDYLAFEQRVDQSLAAVSDDQNH